MKKYKIGYTTGVFDMFHIGHLNILRKSKEMCEILIVGVSTDELTYDEKGKLPTINYEQRSQIVEAIKYVDQVVPQEILNKYIAWEKYKFDVIFHGDDFKGTDMYNEVEIQLKKVGVDVIYFPYTKDVSSTIIKGKILTKSK